MIAFLQPLPIGNAVRCLLAPAKGTSATRVLRKLTDDIASETDPNAAVVFEGGDRGFVDTASLTNGTLYFYRAFDHIDGVWAGSESAAVTPQATAELQGPDVLALVRERLAAGLKAEVAAGRLVHETGAIPVMTAPPAFENTKWPVVSLHFQTDASQERGIGEIISLDEFDPDSGDWSSAEGWLSRFGLQAIGWSLNSDERNALRPALKKVIIGNLPVFSDAGMIGLDASFNDVDEMEAYSAPVFSTVCNLTGLAPAAVEAETAPISDVTVAATSIEPGPIALTIK